MSRRRPRMHVYAAWVVHPRTGKVVCGYVGQRQGDLAVRISEHMYGGTQRCPTRQPWADTVICWKVLVSGRFGRLTLLLLEILAILIFRPVYNYQWNRFNGRRIPRYVAALGERSQACLDRMGTRPPLRLRVFRTA